MRFLRGLRPPAARTQSGRQVGQLPARLNKDGPTPNSTRHGAVLNHSKNARRLVPSPRGLCPGPRPALAAALCPPTGGRILSCQPAPCSQFGEEENRANQRTSLPQQDSGSQRPQRHPESVRELRPGGGRRGRGRSRSQGHPRGAAQTVQGVGSEQGPRRHGPGAPGHADPDGEPTPGGEGAPGRAARAQGPLGVIPREAGHPQSCL